MRVAIPAEISNAETRVAATPETVKKLVNLGATVTVQADAGRASGITNAEYESAGATIAADAAATYKDADLILKVRRPEASELAFQARRIGHCDHGPLRPGRGVERYGAGRRQWLCHGIHAAHHTRAGHGRAL